MRILTVADFFYPETVGGSAIMAFEIMRELASRGHEITVVTRQKEGYGPTGEIEGMRVFRYRVPATQALYPLAVLRARKLINKIAADTSFDLVNMHHASGGIAAELVRKKLRAMPSVFFFQGPWYKEAIAKDGGWEAFERDSRQLAAKYRLRRAVDTFILKNCTRFVTLSDHMFAQASELSPDLSDKHLKIPGGVDISRFRPTEDKAGLRVELGLPQDKIILLTARRLDRRMGLENLIKAMVTVERERDDVVLLIGGRGEIWDELNALVARLQLQRTRLVGYISYDEDLPKYYQASDLFIMPSITMEGFGLSTVEALASGVPVLGTPTGGTPEILRDVLPDFILPSPEPKDIAHGILSKASQLREGRWRDEVRAFAERYSWQRITDRVEDAFSQVTGR